MSKVVYTTKRDTTALPRTLRDSGIDVVADLPGVGENLYDHPVAPVVALAASGVGGSCPGNPPVRGVLGRRMGPCCHWPRGEAGVCSC